MQQAFIKSGLSHLLGTAEDLPIEDEPIDAIMVAYVLGHVDLERFLSECDRVLPFDGKIYVYDIFRTQFPCRYGKDLGYYEFDQDELIEYFEACGFDFKVSKTTAYALPLVADLMPHKDTLQNTVSAAMVFERQ